MNCDLILKRYGLLNGESSIFKIWNDNVLFYRISLNGTGEECIEKTIKNVPIGTYTIEELPWSWAYDVTDKGGTATRSITQKTTDSNVFEFFGTHKGPEAPSHDEAYSTNELKIGL